VVVIASPRAEPKKHRPPREKARELEALSVAPRYDSAVEPVQLMEPVMFPSSIWSVVFNLDLPLITAESCIRSGRDIKTETSGKEDAPDQAPSAVSRTFVPHETPVFTDQAEAEGLTMETIPESGTPAETPPMEKARTPPPAVSVPIPEPGGTNCGLKPETAKRLKTRMLNAIFWMLLVCYCFGCSGKYN
jgi:hypothetical protein